MCHFKNKGLHPSEHLLEGTFFSPPLTHSSALSKTYLKRVSQPSRDCFRATWEPKEKSTIASLPVPLMGRAPSVEQSNLILANDIVSRIQLNLLQCQLPKYVEDMLFSESVSLVLQIDSGCGIF